MMETTASRLEAFRGKLKEKGLDGAVITKRENYLYLSGFTGSAATLLITGEAAVLVTDFRYEEQATAQAKYFQIIKYQGSRMNSLNELVQANKVEKLGFEDRALTYREHGDFRKKLSVKEFLPMGNLVEELRLRKEPGEIAVLSKAVEIADNAFTHVLKYIKPGVSEAEIAAELEYAMKKQGAKGPSFETIVASGERSSMPHGVASDRKIVLGDTVTMDYGAIYEDYCSDMTRTVFVGNPGEEMKEIYRVVLDAQLQALAGAVKGREGKEIDFIARDKINQSGHENHFGHGLGHGVGLEIHEEPRLSPSGAVKMDNGMVVTVEPGIYVPGLGGVRIEDMIVIREDAPLILTQSTKEMIIL